MLTEARIEAQAIPPRLFLPAVEAASVENDKSLQERWAALLANASDPNSRNPVMPSFVEVLKEMTPQEAIFLDGLGKLGYRNPLYRHVISVGAKHEPVQPDRGVPLGNFESLIRGGTYGAEHDFFDHPQLSLVVSDLIRLGLLDRLPWYPTDPVTISLGAQADAFYGGRTPGESLYFLTDFGLAFLDACSAPKDDQSEKKKTGL